MPKAPFRDQYHNRPLKDQQRRKKPAYGGGRVAGGFPANVEQPHRSPPENQSNENLAKHTRGVKRATYVIAFFSLVSAAIGWLMLDISDRQADIQEQVASLTNAEKRARLFLNPKLKLYPGPNTGITVAANNVGSLPARDVEIRAACIEKAWPSQVIRKPNVLQKKFRDVGPPSILAPRQPAFFQGCDIPDALIAKIRAGTHTLFVITEACYRDETAPEKWRFTRSTRELWVDPYGHSWAFVGDNCADETCKNQQCK